MRLGEERGDRRKRKRLIRAKMENRVEIKGKRGNGEMWKKR